MKIIYDPFLNEMTLDGSHNMMIHRGPSALDVGDLEALPVHLTVTRFQFYYAAGTVGSRWRVTKDALRYIWSGIRWADFLR